MPHLIATLHVVDTSSHCHKMCAGQRTKRRTWETSLPDRTPNGLSKLPPGVKLMLMCHEPCNIIATPEFSGSRHTREGDQHVASAPVVFPLQRTGKARLLWMFEAVNTPYDVGLAEVGLPSVAQASSISAGV